MHGHWPCVMCSIHLWGQEMSLRYCKGTMESGTKKGCMMYVWWQIIIVSGKTKTFHILISTIPQRMGVSYCHLFSPSHSALCSLYHVHITHVQPISTSRCSLQKWWNSTSAGFKALHFSSISSGSIYISVKYISPKQTQKTNTKLFAEHWATKYSVWHVSK